MNQEELDYKLVNAAKDGDLKKVKEVLENGADIHTYNDQALCNAAENGHLDVVKYLVEKGANIHACDDQAVRSAAENGHLEVVKYLVENGANIHAFDDEAVRLAAENVHLEVVKFLESVKEGNNFTPSDKVNHPKHYTIHPSGVECIQVVEHMNFNLGNAVKYIWRADHKNNNIEDLQKAEWYIKREIKRLENGKDDI